MTLSVIYRLQAFLECNPSNIYAAFYTISTDSVLALFLCISSASCCYRQLGHAMINLPTKFEVPNFTHYEKMKDDAKCRKWNGLGWLGSPEVIEDSVIRYSAYKLLVS